MKAANLLAFAVAATLGAANLHGQDYPTTTPTGGPIRTIQGGYHHASTAGEGHLRGAADFVRAAGEFNYNESLAKINREQARALHLQNQLLKAKTFFDKRQLNREALAAERGPRPTPEQLRALARAAAPKRLSPLEFEPLTGAIHWPSILLSDEFASERELVAQVMESRDMTNNGVGSETFAVVSEMSGRMQAVLLANIDTISPT